MNWASSVLKYRRISYLTAAAFIGLGLLSWMTMPKEEDPRIQERFGIVTIPYPGATPLEIKNQVINDFEDKLQEIADIKLVRTTIQSEFAVVNIELKDSISDTNIINEAWQDIRVAMNESRSEWPSAVPEPKLDRNILDQDAIVLALTGSDDVLQLKVEAERLKNQIQMIHGVKKVRLLGDPEEQVSINLDVDEMARLGIDYNDISSRLSASNQILGSGTLKIRDKKTMVTTNSRFKSLEEFRRFPIFLNSGQFVELGEIANIAITPKLPEEKFMYFNGMKSVGLGVVPETGINLIKLGDRVNTFLKSNTLNSDITVNNVSFQPSYVDSRLNELTLSLLMGMIIIAALLIVTMGFRVGIFVALMVPAITLASLAFYSIGGGILHQISIAAFVLALGLLVDNIIVIVEGVQEKLDRNIPNREAAIMTIKEFAAPLAAATGTTIASFIPLLGSVGSTADFTRSIPQVVTLTLGLSYIFSVFITPVLSSVILKKSKENKRSKIGKYFSFLYQPIIKYPLITSTVAVIVLIATLPLATKLKMQFFPLADREHIVVDLNFPEGTHLKHTDIRSEEFRKALNEKIDSIVNITSFVGEGVPRFYYNLNQTPFSPHYAQFIVETRSFEDVSSAIEKISDLARSTIPEANVIAKALGQGPPIDADIEIQLLGQNRESLVEASRTVLKILREQDGARAIRSDVGIGIPNVRYSISDTNAMRYGLSRSSITQALIINSRGLPITNFRKDGESLDVQLLAKNTFDTTNLGKSDAFMSHTRNSILTLSDIATPQLEFEPAILKFRNSVPVVHVYGELEDGAGFNEVLSPLFAAIEKTPLPGDVTLKIGGGSGESESANAAIFKVIPIGVLILLISLLAQFNSFRKVAIVFLAVPFLSVGVIGGLLVMGVPFGFFSLLGSLALVGIVVNNAILLIDYADRMMQEGNNAQESMRLSIERRIRPILLTTLTTVAGLMPLALTKATLWPPFAYTVIFGLLASSIFTLFMVPSVYIIIYRSKKKAEVSRMHLKKVANATLVTAIALGSSQFISNPVSASEKLKLQDAISFASQHSEVQATEFKLKSREAVKEVQDSSAFFPKLGLRADRKFVDRNLETEGPFGISIPGPSKARWQGGINIDQPLFSYGEMIKKPKMLAEDINAHEKQRAHAISKVEFEIAQAYLKIMRLNTELESLVELKGRLSKQEVEINRLIVLGRAREVDRVKIQIAVSEVNTSINQVKRSQKVVHDLLNYWVNRNGKYETQSVKDLEEMISGLNINSKQTGDRSDIKAMDHQISALDHEAKLIESEWYPNVNLNFQSFYVDPSQYSTEHWNELSLSVTIPIWTGGTRKWRKREILERKSQTSVSKSSLLKLQNVRKEEIKADFESLKEKIKHEKESLKLAETAIKMERELYTNGKSTMNDVLDGEFLSQEKRLKWRVSQIALLEKWFEWQFENGQPLKI